MRYASHSICAINKIGLVPARIEIAMSNLPIVIGTDGIVTLADMHQDMNVVRKPFDRHVDYVDSGLNFFVIRDCGNRVHRFECAYSLLPLSV